MSASQVAIPTTRAARQALIVQLLAKDAIGSQRALRARLADEGISVTQATLSRDLEELRAVKVRNSSGQQVYQIPDPGETVAAAQGARAQLDRWCSEVLISAQRAVNQVVLRTPPGAAQLLASGIDRAMLDGVLGCIAGDDTVLVIANDERQAERLLRELLALA
ncbi:arginine repressor [Actinobaculum sp. 313]|uniref:arginine repressor n=1 Tax=Actinobaculum sp. 313 TaxID=2495645 RepID=UPI000D52724A|nr:arginine repressor [Actinobaculum sp. 313]AWE42460.1 arginine repressor [Actinobaculum sp. 313]